jgi:hypothetical protein
LEIEEQVRKEFKFLVWRLFKKGLKEAGEDSDFLEDIFLELMENPQRGPVLSGGIRKARIGSKRKNKGKSGGYRYLYYLQTERTVHLISLLDKSEAENFDKAVLKELAVILKGLSFSK